MKFIRLNFRIVSHVEPNNIPRVECQSKVAPRCHDWFIPDHEGQTECLHCTYFKSRK